MNEHSQTDLLTGLSSMLDNLVADNLDEQTIWLYGQGLYIAVKVKHILYCESQTQPKESTKVFYIDENDDAIKHIVSSYGIGKWEQKLAKLKFIRIHKTYLANYKMLSVYSRKEGVVTIKHIPQPIPVSKEGKKLMTLWMGKMQT